MPELPEVETIRRGLEKEVLHKRIIDVQINLPRLIKNLTENQFKTRLTGSFIKTIKRRGKYLLCLLNTKDCLIFHLGMSGLLLYLGKDMRTIPKIKEKHNHLSISFEDASKIIYNDVRQFGKIWLIREGEKLPAIESLGWEPLDDKFTFQIFFDLFRNKKGGIKSQLMNQKYITGVGNIYANEALFQAGIHPQRKSDSLTDQELQKLYFAIKDTLKRAILCDGTTMADESYRNIWGKPGNFAEHILVYGKKNGHCPICGNPLSLIRIENRSTFVCTACQK
ncbi:MAG TPA: bifunctional DNA-formamidopyrimidine glycosylase/DNA-(apurinic or apyrimidinic site) lyase [Atribacterota bacterium]|nr:bifunctional DNA-formamidopyrimidine glycosylase/DNA-(apurinic or apyrimidinic site) lyase [Atribacterota bacterium]